MPNLTVPQRWVLAIGRSVSGNLSLVASSIIVYQIMLRYKEQKRSASSRNVLVTPYHRLILGLSIVDILYSFWAGLSTIVVPASSGVIYGFGTTATCSVQGFFSQFCVANTLYMASLSTYFMLKIRYNVSDYVLHQRYEFWLHLVPWVFAIGTGSMGVGLKVFNPITIPEMGCWLGPIPKDCLWNGPCTRGYKFAELLTFYGFFFAYAWLFASFFVVLVNNTLIYRAIRNQERRNSSYFAARLQSNTSMSWGLSRRTTNGSSHAIVQPSIDEPTAELGNSATTNTIDNEDVRQNAPANVCETEAANDESSSDLQIKEVAVPSSVIDIDEARQEADFRSSATTNTPVVARVDRRLPNRAGVKSSRVAAVQSILYVSTAFSTAVWIFMPFLGLKLGLGDDWRFFFAFMVNCIVPSQGFFNLIIYVRLEYLRVRTTHKNWSRLRCVRVCLFSPDIQDPGLFKGRRRLVMPAQG